MTVLRTSQIGYSVPNMGVKAVRPICRAVIALFCGLLACAGAYGQQRPPTKAQLSRALFEALEDGKSEQMASLLERGADPNIRDEEIGWTPLMWAAGWSDVDDVRTLVRHGAKLDLRDREGCTALMYAVAKGRDANVTALLKSGANARLHDKAGRTALFIAKANLAANTTPAAMAFEPAHERKQHWMQIVRDLQIARKKQPLRRKGSG